MIGNMVLEEVRDTKAIERYFLLEICDLIDTSESVLGEKALQGRAFAVAQGALRGAYNGLGELIYDSKHLSDTRKKLLEKFNNNIFKIRDDLVGWLEADNIDLAEVVNSNNIYGRVGSAKAALKRYINYWYKP